MKYLKIYKIFTKSKIKKFEGYHNSTEKDLVEQLDQNFIEEMYDNNCTMDVDELVSIYGPNIIWNNIDDDRYVNDFIQDEINNRDMRDFSDYDFKKYIEQNISDDEEQKIIEIYKENNDIKDNDKISKIEGIVSFAKSKKGKTKIIITSSDTGEIKKYIIPIGSDILVQENERVKRGTMISKGPKLEYEDSMLDELSEDELRDVIEYCNEEDDFMEYIITDRYEGMNAHELISEWYGDIKDGTELYKILSNYIDDDGIIEEWKSNESYDYKVEYVEGLVDNNIDIQNKLLEINPSNALLLADVYNNRNSNISDDYKFQKLYIQEFVKKELEEYYDADIDDELKSNTRAEALNYLFDNFGLHPDIEDEFKDDMWMIASKKYNL